jgi:hypothetical protein
LGQTLHYGDEIEMELQPYQTLIVHVEATEQSTPILSGVRAREVNQSSEKATWELFGLPGQTLSVLVKGVPAPGKITLDGLDIKAVKTDQGLELPLTFEGDKTRFTTAGGALQFENSGNIGQSTTGSLAGTCTANIPPGVKASMYVLCVDPPPSSIDFQCHAIVNTNGVSVTEIRCPAVGTIPASTLAELPLKPWVFFRFELPEGKSEVAVSIQAGEKSSKPFAVWAGWWLWAEQPLKKRTLTMDFSRSLQAPAMDPLPFPSAMEFQRQVRTLQPLKAFGPVSNSTNLHKEGQAKTL